MSEVRDVARRDAHAVPKVVERGARIAFGSLIGWGTVEPVVSTILGQHDAHVVSLSHLGSPGNQPAGDIRVPVKREDRPGAGRAVSDQISEQIDAVGRTVPNLR